MRVLCMWLLWNAMSFVFSVANLNNVCKNSADYDSIQFNPNCWYNPDVDLDVPSIIRRYGYPLEIFNVVTDDNYVLQLFRIAHGKHFSGRTKNQPVFLQHGVLASAASWVINGNNSLGFILADAGYDVWFGNSRGSTYSKGHTRLSAEDYAYWNFSFHEMAIHDLPSSFDLITKVTGRKDTIFIGQSMGATLAYVYASTLPKHASHRIKLIISLAPAVFLSHIRTPLKVLAKYSNLIENITTSVAFGEFLPNDPALMKELCLQSKFSFVLCELLAFVAYGFDPEQFMPEMFPVILAHYPAGTSVKTFKHLAQGVNKDSFAQFDYGKNNFKHYNSIKPPEYNLSQITIPNYIMYSENDFISATEDVFKLYYSLPNTAGLYNLKNKKFTHFDFFFSKDVVKIIFNELLRVLGKFNKIIVH